MQPFEGELRAGLGLPIGNYHNGKASIGASLGIEGRHNFPTLPLSVGVMVDLISSIREFDNIIPDGYYSQNNRTLAFAATTEYNLRRDTKMHPFTGIAIGMARQDVEGDRYIPTKATSIFFSPRIGIELLYHLRLGLQLNISRHGYNTSYLTLGFVIGGRPKR